MKKIITILCLVLLSVHSYSQGVISIPVNQTVTRNGLVYHQLSTEPLTGTVVSFHEDGRLQYRGNFKDGKRDGLLEWFDEEGNLTMTQTWENGELIGQNLNP